MSARILDGKKIAQALRAEIKQRVDRRLASGKRPPGLAVLKVGNEAASEVYVRNKREAVPKPGLSLLITTCRWTFPRKKSCLTSTS